MAKKGNRVQVIMECTVHKESGMPGTSRYITTKNKKNTTERLELKKFNPILKKYTMKLQALLMFLPEELPLYYD
jgi:large subunit ribosomal protein L33